MQDAMTIPAVRAAVDKVWNKLNKLPAWDRAEVEAKADVVGEARSRQVLVLFCISDGFLPKHSELAEHLPQYEGRVVLRGERHR